MRTQAMVSLPTAASPEEKLQDVSHVESYILSGTLRSAEANLSAELKRNKGGDQTRFALGMVQFLRAVEELAQSFYHYGLKDLSKEGVEFPILRIPVPTNPNPATLSYTQAREMIEHFRRKLGEAESTLALISDPNVNLPIHFGMIRLDLNGDGRADECESLWKVYAKLSGNEHVQIAAAQHFFIKFDRGDVHWLRGYCNLLMSFCDIYLAYDSSETFNCTAHLFFSNVASPYKFLSSGRHVRTLRESDTDFMDLISFIHTIRWTVVEPQRMTSALHHLEAVVTQSRESWKWILAETDDDHEWLPNPHQTGVIPKMHVTQEMVGAWSEMMSELEKLLAGKALVPFWRGESGWGVNVREVFLHPRNLDLVLWVQGPAALPYLQHGEMTPFGVWRRLPRVFGNQFPGFAAWFN